MTEKQLCSQDLKVLCGVLHHYQHYMELCFDDWVSVLSIYFINLIWVPADICAKQSHLQAKMQEIGKRQADKYGYYEVCIKKINK